MELLVRKVRPQDAEGIVNILNPIIEAGRFTVLETLLTVEEEREFIADFPARGVFHVAERRQDGRMVGFLSLEPFATYTHAFDHVATMGTYVDLSLRRRGIGRSLASATFQVAGRKGFEKVFTYIRARNTEALAFYRALGFRIVGTAQRQVKIDGKYEDEIIVEKFLSL
ncbi:MAG: GNAT family N-acetyltransferase [Anaerolineae bacterium]|nr:GNAT family N-acetyltransferase [Anaerolineae bacterium]NIN93727.1 GNAT family N-acetyltransferase [Anaerolineae bacterium]NIQ76764.1 GNAT family N-acetyltransferase [Anaerolineae bacterium]